MNINRIEKIKKWGIYSIFICLFISSLLILVNKRFHILDKVIKPMDKADESIKIIDKNTQWSYIKEGENPGVGNVWASLNYNEEDWKKGYGDFSGPGRQDVGTLLKLKRADNSNIPSYFFRYEFNIEEELLETIGGIEAKIEHSGGGIVYLNGRIIFAGNVPQGGYDSNLDVGVSQIIEGNNVSLFQVSDLSALRQGKNVIGVEIHQAREESQDVYFNFNKFNLSKRELIDKAYSTDGLILEVGNSNEDIFINWMTSSSDFYRLEYIEGSKYTGEKDFSKYGQTKLMGRKRLGDSNLYLNDVELTRLKYDTDYKYRILKIGGTKPSKVYSFTSGKRKGFSFGLLDGSSINKFSNLIGEMEFIVTSIEQANSDDVKAEQGFMKFRQAQVLKEVGLLSIPENFKDEKYKRELYDMQFNRKNTNIQGNHYLAYQDTLIICINSDEKDYNMHKIFIEDAIEKNKRKWTIVAGKNIEEDEKFLEIFHDLDINLVLESQKHMTQVDVDNERLVIKKYNLETGLKFEEYSL